MDNQQEIINMTKRNQKILQIITKDKLKELYTLQKLSDSEIGKIFEVSGGIIHRLRGKYNIKALEYYQRHPKQVLDLKEKELIIGTLLGDGHIRCRDKIDKRAYPQIMLEQSVKHAEYAFWLNEQFKDWLHEPDKQLKQNRKINKKTGKAYHSYSIQTVCHPVFNEFYKYFYNQRKKIINIDFIEQYFTELSLSVWLMDDGTISKDRNIMLCSHSFSKQENEMLSLMLKKKFNIYPNIWTNNVNEPKYYLGFSKQDSIKLTNLVKNFVIPSMQYKLISSETTKEADNKNKLSEGIVQQ